MLTSSSGGLRPKALSPFLSLISSDTFGTVVTKKLLKERRPRANILNLIVGVSTRGVPGPTSKLSLRVPAQMGRREMEHKGGGGGRKPRLVLSCAQGGCACSRGLQAFATEGESLFVSPSSRATTFSYEGHGPSFYRCKERVQVYNGGVATC
jgi:hypothetical protein